MGPGSLKRVGGRPARALAAAFAAAVVALVFSGHSCSSTETSGRPDGGPVCQHGGTPCPAGTACENGNCVQTCKPSDPACPSGQYCMGDASIDQVCAPTSPIICASVLDCPVPQGCLPVLCTAGETLADGGLSACNPNGDANDMCAPDAICLVLNSGGGTNVQCRGMPACAQNGGCPVGPFGAVCNVRADGGRILEGKQRICLYGYCTSQIDCASGQHCVFQPDSGLVGQCYSGFPGSPCNTSQDCFNDGGCTGVDAGAWGTCQ